MLLLVAGPAGAVVGGQSDTSNTYANVGMLQGQFAPGEFPDRFVKTTQGICFGDSGGPLFHDGTVVAINTWTFSPRCDAPNLSYRVDAPTAQSFLDSNL